MLTLQRFVAEEENNKQLREEAVNNVESNINNTYAKR